jgi:hypothetical protein
MQKIISVFQRNYETDRLIRDEVVPGAEWVLAGEGVATRKFDGTCAMVRGGKLYKRYDAKRGKTPPEGFEPAQEPDPVTGHHPGWLPIGDGPEDRWFREAFDVTPRPPDGTYELCGPKVQGNREGYAVHILIPHGSVRLPDFPRTFDGMREALRDGMIEGVVFHHPDGRMTKVKGKDFGFSRPLGRTDMSDRPPAR